MGEAGLSHAPESKASTDRQATRETRASAETAASSYGGMTPRLTPRGFMLGLQRSAGNAAVSAMIVRAPSAGAVHGIARAPSATTAPPRATEDAPFAEGQGTMSKEGQYQIWGTWRQGDNSPRTWSECLAFG